MNPDRLIRRIKTHPDYPHAGMILTHVGVVRGVSRDGRPVRGIDISVDRNRIAPIVSEMKERSGIIEILVEITDRPSLAVGDDIMVVVVAGDVRENVLAVMADTIDAIKQTVTRKTEHFA